jgi:hypothetical protein
MNVKFTSIRPSFPPNFADKYKHSKSYLEGWRSALGGSVAIEAKNLSSPVPAAGVREESDAVVYTYMG